MIDRRGELMKERAMRVVIAAAMMAMAIVAATVKVTAMVQAATIDPSRI